MKDKTILSRTAIWILGTVLIVCSGCENRQTPDPSTPHGTMIGHWQRVKGEARAGNSSLEGTLDGGKVTPEDLYISANSQISVIAGTGSSPVRRNYTVQEQNPNDFSLKQYVEGPTGQKILSEVKFSADRKEMHVINTADLPSSMPSSVRSQIGGLTLDIAYKRIDDKISP